MIELFDANIQSTVENIKTKEIPRRVVLEVGIGGSSSPFLNGQNIEDYKDAHLIRTDIFTGEESEEERKYKAEKFGGFAGSGNIVLARKFDKVLLDRSADVFKGDIEYINCEANKIPVDDNSVDEIFIANVFSAPGFRSQDKGKILREFRRVLKSGGELVFAETYTPQCALDNAYRDSDRKVFEKAINEYVAMLVAVSGLELKAVEFPKFSKVADTRREKGLSCEKFLSQYQYGKKFFGVDFLPSPARPDPDYKFIVVLSKKQSSAEE